MKRRRPRRAERGAARAGRVAQDGQRNAAAPAPPATGSRTAGPATAAPSQRREQIGREIGDIAAQLEIEREQIGEHDYSIERQQEQIEALHEQLEDARKARGESEILLNRQRQLAQSAERAAQEAVFQHKNCVNKIDEFERALAALSGQLEELAGRIAELEGEAGSMQQGKLDAQLQQALQARQERENSLAAARDALAEAGKPCANWSSSAWPASRNCIRCATA